MIPPKTGKAIRSHKNIRSMRSLYTKVGPARGRWSRLRESEQLAQAAPRMHAVRIGHS
jgi:hypothetical protein